MWKGIGKCVGAFHQCNSLKMMLHQFGTLYLMVYLLVLKKTNVEQEFALHKCHIPQMPSLIRPFF